MKKYALAFAFVLLCGVGTQAQQTVLGTPYSCQSVGMNVWTNIGFPAQTANFELQWDSTLSASAMDSEMSLSVAAEPSYPQTSVVTIFQAAGVIQAMNAATFTAVSKIPYVGNTKYHFTVDVNMANHTFNSYVGTTTRTQIASNYAFRTTSGTPASLGFMTVYSEPSSLGGGVNGTNTICNIAVLTYPTATVTHQVTLKWNAATLPTGAPAVTGYGVLKGQNSTGPFTQIFMTSPTALGYVDPNVTAGATDCYTVQAVNSNGPSSNAIPICVVIP